jgi:hypothetical protein
MINSHPQYKELLWKLMDSFECIYADEEDEEEVKEAKTVMLCTKVVDLYEDVIPEDKRWVVSKFLTDSKPQIIYKFCRYLRLFHLIENKSN